MLYPFSAVYQPPNFSHPFLAAQILDGFLHPVMGRYFGLPNRLQLQQKPPDPLLYPGPGVGVCHLQVTFPGCLGNFAIECGIHTLVWDHPLGKLSVGFPACGADHHPQAVDSTLFLPAQLSMAGIAHPQPAPAHRARHHLCAREYIDAILAIFDCLCYTDHDFGEITDSNQRIRPHMAGCAALSFSFSQRSVRRTEPHRCRCCSRTSAPMRHTLYHILSYSAWAAACIFSPLPLRNRCHLRTISTVCFATI